MWPEDAVAVLRRRRRVPHGVPLPADAAACSWRRGWRTASRSSTSSTQTPALPGGRAVGDVPAQPRRADARDGHRRGAGLHVPRLRRRPAGAHQPRHPPPPRAAAGQRPPPDRADERPAVLAARHARRLLRRRDRHGRQLLPRRPQRRAHADAVVGRPQRRLLARQPAAAVPAGRHRPRVRRGQRRGAAPQPELAAVVHAPPDRAAQAPLRRSAAGRSSSCRPRTARCWRSCAATSTRTSSSSPTCRGSRSTSSSTSRASRGACRRSCSATRRSRRSATCRTC